MLLPSNIQNSNSRQCASLPSPWPPFPAEWMIHTYRLGYISLQYKLTYTLTHAPAHEPAGYFPQKKDEEEAEQNGPHPAFREGIKGRSSHHWAATDEHMHVAHIAV